MPFELTELEMDMIVDSLDDTGGYLIKESELKHWIEYYVNLVISSCNRSVKDIAEIELRWEEFRKSVDVYKNQLKNKKTFLQRIFPFKITIERR